MFSFYFWLSFTWIKINIWIHINIRYFKIPYHRAGYQLVWFIPMALFIGVQCEIMKGLIWLTTCTTQDYTNHNQDIFAIRAVALVSFYFAMRQSYKKNNKSWAFSFYLAFYQKFIIFPDFSFFIFVGTHINPRKRQPRRLGQPPDIHPKLCLPAEAGSCGPTLVVAPSPC
jgi:hypothetical protein